MPAATPAAAAVRTLQGSRHLSNQVRAVARWIAHSREHTNYTFELTDNNIDQLGWWVAAVARVPVEDARRYINEAQDDRQLKEHYSWAIRQSPRWRLADPELRLHKRLGWYALIRATRPRHVVETGTDKGLGSIVMAAALLRNGTGKLTTMDINAHAGDLISGPYADVVDAKVGDSVQLLRHMSEPVDMFLHDSLHTSEHETLEFNAVAGQLSTGALVLSDYAHASLALSRWSECNGRGYLFFAEEPVDHWFPGEGIGASFPIYASSKKTGRDI